ncbi:hypothetical protein [Campylobacter sp. RM16191]|uniref:hypothetical protein n=1 Tax=Campylobacter sp. RM16191 TaxID=1705728 RepID=UPI0014744D20|nr:hypothetical protein [Campylobacter sp. RM16191]
MKYLEILYFCVSLVLINVMGLTISFGLNEPIMGIATIVISFGLILIFKMVKEHEREMEK